MEDVTAKCHFLELQVLYLKRGIRVHDRQGELERD